MKIGIDIDEIVVEFSKGYLNFYNEIHGTNFKFGEMYSHKFEEPMNTTEEKILRVMEDFFETENFERLDLVEGIKDLISELSKEHEIFFITARDVRIREKTKAFLEKHFPDFSLRVLHSGDCFGGNKTKAEICVEQGIDFLIEDNKDYALSCADKGINVFLLKKPWNRNHEEHPNIIKINHLKEVLEKIK